MTWSVGTYPKHECACGRLVGSNNEKRHRRKCVPWLLAYAASGGCLHGLDERKVKVPLIACGWQCTRDPG